MARAARALTSPGAIFLDPRGDQRALRVSWHADDGPGHEDGAVVVLSMWRDNLCVATFRLGVDEVPDLIAMLREGLDVAFASTRTTRSA